MNNDPLATAAATLPVTILTGFLGSGKTTVLNHLLAQPGLSDCAVLINEFGEVAIDHLLVRPLTNDVVLLDSGCLCCTMRGDLVDALRDLWIKRSKGEVPEFRRVLIETTGLADPAPILHTLMVDQVISTYYRLDGVVCMIDAVTGGASLDHHREAVKQAAIADRLLLTKLDIAAPAAVAALRARLEALNPGARRLTADHGTVNPADILDCGLFDSSTKTPDVVRWLNEAAYEDEEDEEDDDDHPACGPECDHPDHHHHHHGDGHHHHESRHEDGIESFVFTYDTPVRWENLATALEFLISTRGEQLLRVKGIVHADDNDKPLVIHGVQHLFHPTIELPDWPDADRRTRIVFITRDLPRTDIEELFQHVLADDI